MTTETTQTDHQEREQFESWFLQNNPSWEITSQERRTGTYIFERANIQWQAWQAVLQSPEVQALRKDAAMLDWFISQEAQMQTMNRLPSSNVMYRVGWPDYGEYTVEWHSCPRAAINAAMEQQT